jgi:hypothetical protein
LVELLGFGFHLFQTGNCRLFGNALYDLPHLLNRSIRAFKSKTRIRAVLKMDIAALIEGAERGYQE